MSVTHRPDFLDRRQDLRQRRGVAAGEDVLAQPGVGAAGGLHAADRVQQRDAVVRQQVLHLPRYSG